LGCSSTRRAARRQAADRRAIALWACRPGWPAPRGRRGHRANPRRGRIFVGRLVLAHGRRSDGGAERTLRQRA